MVTPAQASREQAAPKLSCCVPPTFTGAAVVGIQEPNTAAALLCTLRSAGGSPAHCAGLNLPGPNCTEGRSLQH